MTTPLAPSRPHRSNLSDTLFRVGTGAVAVLVIAMVVGIGIVLVNDSTLSIRKFGLHFWTTRTWDPVALGIAIFLSELCPQMLRQPLAFLTELLAAIPSIVYGVWGMFVLVPAVRSLEVHTPAFLRGTPLFSGPPLGVGMLAAALVLAVMIIPFTATVAREILKAVPVAQREAAYALGATRWEAIRLAVFYGRTGIIGAVMLGFGRALGETMAVTMVIGNNPQAALSLYAPQYTMAAVLANEFTEAADALYLNALVEIGLVLFLITVAINSLSRMLIWRVGRLRAIRPLEPKVALAA